MLFKFYTEDGNHYFPMNIYTLFIDIVQALPQEQRPFPHSILTINSSNVPTIQTENRGAEWLLNNDCFKAVKVIFFLITLYHIELLRSETAPHESSKSYEH